MKYFIYNYKVRKRYYVAKGKYPSSGIEGRIIYNTNDLNEEGLKNRNDIDIWDELELIGVNFIDTIDSEVLYSKGDYIWFKDRKYKIKNIEIKENKWDEFELYLDDSVVIEERGKKEAEELLLKINELYPKETIKSSILDKICFWR